MVRRLVIGAALFGALAAAPAWAAPEQPAEARLDAAIERAIRAEGPFLLRSERALLERKCGYAPGAWKGESFSMNDGVLRCENGRRVDDPEVRAMMRVAGPRISQRVRAVMDSPAVKNALSLVVDGAVERALKDLREEFPRRSPRR